MIHEFINKIVVHERADKGCRFTTQRVDVHLNFIGAFVIPKTNDNESQEVDEEAERLAKKRAKYREYYKKYRDRYREKYRERKVAKEQQEEQEKQQGEQNAMLQAP